MKYNINNGRNMKTEDEVYNTKQICTYIFTGRSPSKDHFPYFIFLFCIRETNPSDEGYLIIVPVPFHIRSEFMGILPRIL